MGKHKNSKQELIFVQFMEENPDLAKNFVKGDRVIAEEKWKELTTLLNAEGPPQKDVNGWKKIWSDWKGCIKKKVAHNKMETRATGGGPFNQYILSQNEESVARICGIFAAVEGIAQARTFGTESETNNLSVRDSDEDERPQTTISTGSLINAVCVSLYDFLKLFTTEIVTSLTT
ncbi:PREDICTED: uncharacterized protein LOC108363249 [Rhagoletis zephyria]|uniref:uncharacterized protein LOC108363249 n=1 Tax=Rhagoletis zephyria TaxID=28612 RepID=UPI0008112D84|nr:PREDICTED: uncharacterized protein LOC108363249 [Rhagoletis zephyria]